MSHFSIRNLIVFAHATSISLREFASTIPKSFKARYDPYTQRIELLDTKTQILKNMRGVGREIRSLTEAMSILEG